MVVAVGDSALPGEADIFASAFSTAWPQAGAQT
jgi:hypothetical protein